MKNYYRNYILKETWYFFVQKRIFLEYKYYAPLCLRMVVIMKISHVTEPSRYVFFENTYGELNYLISKDNLLSLLFSLPSWLAVNGFGDNENMLRFYEFWQSEILNLLVRCRSFIFHFLQIMKLNKDRKRTIKIFSNFSIPILLFLFVVWEERIFICSLNIELLE
jgi:hypothetical protein